MNKTICLIDADSIIPNIPLMKLSTYHKSRGDNVFLMRANLPYYPDRQKKVFHAMLGADKTYASVVYSGNKEYIKGKDIIFGGTGVDLTTVLPDNIESYEPDYSIYPENKISYGFISRGCIRKCSFCVVSRKEGHIRQVANVDDIVRHKVVKFLDNNILALPNHKDILKEIADKKIKCHFNQGLDIRLTDKENVELLHRIRYIDDYIFAFDDISLMSLIDKKLKLFTWMKPWDLKFYVYANPTMPLSDTIRRIEWLKAHKCLSFFMRDVSCWNSENHDFYVDLASYVNRPVIYKNMEFTDFMHQIHDKVSKGAGTLRFLSDEQLKGYNVNTVKSRIERSIELYESNR